MRTFIRQPGNKTRHLRHIIPHLPTSYNTYFEPFVGTGAMFLRLQPDKWVINDINDDLMNLYQSIKNDLPNLIKYIKTFATRTNFKNITNDERLRILKMYMQKFIKLPFTTKRASHYLILKMTSYMGSIITRGEYRFNSLEIDLLKGLQSSMLSDRYFTNLQDVSKLLNMEGGNIHSMDYKKILRMVKKDDFCFIDSPYDELVDYAFTYNTMKNGNNTDFVLDLYKEVKKLDTKKAKWLMTQADTEKVRKTFKEYIIISYPVYRGFSKKFKNELIIKNY